MMNELVNKLIQLSGQAEQTFTASTQGRSACQLQKLGQLSSQVKYSEGRDYVARQMLKIARIDEPQLDKIILNLNQLETKHRGIKNSLVLTSPDWQAYADGALSMIAEIRMLLPEN